MNTMHRRLFDTQRGKWFAAQTMKWLLLDDYLAKNISRYTFWLGQRIAAARAGEGARVA